MYRGDFNAYNTDSRRIRDNKNKNQKSAGST